ncbi:hypothetical protein D9619_000536 [Psilocybe cf. subviscida]|uniref:Uncharacterized protein n=1 Tax=Psilocybe cf. subviscida TaxID=2480587 RepID=A0A8H5BDV6_9AGAR|nr:hypothetical protein D9619_000536 [Psilocybe cf. subviscida]
MSDSDDEYCHESPAHVAESWKDRLQVPCLLAQREIPCLVFGEDALSLVFHVPTVLFSLHILVADKHVGQAVEAITRSSFPYKINTDHLIPNYNDPIIVDPDQTKAYPNSIHLRNTNEPADKHQSSQIIIHPETHFNFIIDDYKLSTSVFMFPEALFPESVRLPQRAAMVDSIIDSLLDPNSGVVTIVGSRELRRWLAYIIVYGICRDSKIVVAEQLHPDTQELINAVKVENRPFLEAWKYSAGKWESC